MSWAMFFLVVLLGAVLYGLTGALVLRLAGMRWTNAVVFSLPVGVGALGILSTGFGLLGIVWNWIAPVGLLVVLGFALIAKELAVKSRVGASASGSTLPSPQPTQAALTYGLLGVLVFAAVFLQQFLKVVPSSEMFPIYGDAAFHLQATQLVDATGNANPFDALGALYSPVNPLPIYYPTLWHALSALLVPIIGLVPATNAMMLIMAVIIWPVGLAGLVWVLRPTAAMGPLIVNLFACFVIIFPTIVGTSFAIYPFALSAALLPGALAFIFFLRGRDIRAGVTGMFFSVAALALSQPSTALLYGIALFAMGLVWVFKNGARQFTQGRPLRAIIPVVAVVVLPLLALAGLLRVGYIQKLGEFNRPSLGYKAALLGLLNGETAVTYSWMPWFMIAVLAVVGVVVVARTQAGQIMIVTSAGYLLVYLASAGPDNALRVLTGPFYKDYQRLSIPVLMAMIVFAAIALATLIQLVLQATRAPLRTMLTLLLVVALLGVTAVAMKFEDGKLRRLTFDYFSLAYVLPQEPTASLDAQDLELIELLNESGFPEGSRVIGLPSSGILFSSVVGDVSPFVPITWPTTADQRYVTDNFNRIHSDPQVCEILRDYNVVAFLEVPSEGDGHERQDREYAGFQDVDTGTGFELIGQSGDTKLWGITACD